MNNIYDKLKFTSSSEIQTAFPWPLEVLHDYVANVLNEPKSDIDIQDNLLEWGMSSLALMSLTTKLKKDNIDIGLDELLADPTIQNWHHLLEKKYAENSVCVADEVQPISDTDAPFPLTDVQLAYWLGRNTFFELGGVGAHGYIEVTAKGICPKRLEKSLNQTIQTNPMLRAIVNDDGEQRILSSVPNYNLNVHKVDKLEALREVMEHEVVTADTWPLFNICLSEISDNNYLIHISFDILIFDLKSLELWVSKWWELYESPMTKPVLSRYGFQDYVAQQSQQSVDAHLSRQYWEERIPTLPLGPSIPLIRSTETVVPKFTREQTIIPKKIWDNLQKKVQKSGAMPSSLLLAAYSKILATWGESQHFCLTMTLFNRDMTGVDLEQVIGDFTSLFVLEADARQPEGFIDFVKNLQQQMLQDLNHKAVSGVEVLGKMAEHHKTPNKAMLPFVFTSTLGTGRSYLDAFSSFGEITKAAVQTPQVLIDHQTLEHKGNLVLNWDYVEGVFPDGLVKDMAASHYRFLMLLAESEEAWKDPYISLLPPEQQQQRLDYNSTDKKFADTSKLLHEPFLRQAHENPTKVALIHGEQQITYAELDRISNTIAEVLLTSGVKPGQLIAVVMEKCWQQIAAAIGILKSGAAYIPIDALLPKKRIESLLDESHATIAILANNELAKNITQQQKMMIETDWLQSEFTGSTELMNRAQGDHLAYVIFTSGSTGKPKGAMLNHSASLNTLLDINDRYQVDSASCCLMVSSFSFDLSVYDIFGVLGAGGKVVIPLSSPLPDPSDWLNLVVKHRVNLWNSVPALLHLFYDYLKDVEQSNALNYLQHILMSGDWLNVSICAEIRHQFPNIRLISVGGPTETAIWSGTYEIHKIDPQWLSIPFGHSMANQQLYIFNKQLQETPDWVRGDLYVGGAGIGQGYWQDKAKTDAAFIIHPSTGQALYRSGDQARMQSTGLIELLGRDDNQVKINGVRVELGEVEFFLSGLEGIEQAIVVARRNKELGDQLYAFVTCNNSKGFSPQTISITSIENELRDLLPSQLIPRVIKPLEAMPLNANGKIDRNALADLILESSEEKNQISVVAGTEIEKKLLVLWEDLLSNNIKDVSSNFFSLGGSSLLATRLAGQINTTFNTNIAVIKIFEHATVIAQASLIASILDPEKAIKPVKEEVLPTRRKGIKARSNKKRSARESAL